MLDVFGQASGAKVAFGDVVRLSKERSQDPEADGFERYVGLEHLEPDNLKVRKWGSIEDGVTFTSVFRPGQVLFGKRRAYQRKVAVADFNGVCSSDIYVLEPKNDQLLPELLPFICQSEPFYDYVISMSQGGLSPRVNWKALAKYEFPLPPLEEQRRIIKVLQAAEDNLSRLVMAKTAGECLLASLILSSISVKGEYIAELRIGDLINLEYGKGLPETERDGGQYPVCGSAGIIGYHSKKLLDGPVIVVGRKGSAGVVNWYEDGCWPIDTTFWVKNKSDIPIYLLYFILKGLELSRLAEQTAMPGLDRNRVYDVHIPEQAIASPETTVNRLHIVKKGCERIQKYIDEFLHGKRILLTKSLHLERGDV